MTKSETPSADDAKDDRLPEDSNLIPAIFTDRFRFGISAAFVRIAFGEQAAPYARAGVFLTFSDAAQLADLIIEYAGEAPAGADPEANTRSRELDDAYDAEEAIYVNRFWVTVAPDWMQLYFYEDTPRGEYIRHRLAMPRLAAQMMGSLLRHGIERVKRELVE